MKYYPILILFALFIFWCAICRNWYVCGIKNLCDDTEVIAAPPLQNSSSDRTNFVFSFKHGSADLIEGNKMQPFFDSINNTSPVKSLIVYGGYLASESSVIGMERARMISANLKPDLRKNVIHKDSLIQGTDGAALVDQCFFELVNDTSEAPSPTVNLNRTFLAFFESGSVKPIMDKNYQEGVSSILALVDPSNVEIILEGHADNTGDSVKNKALALQRAKSVQAIIQQYTNKNFRFKILSYGDKDPVANNNTEQGKHQNRRVELVFEKK